MVTMSGGNFNQRLRGFMKSGDEEEFRLRREWHLVELRKSKRNEQAQKRRRIPDSPSSSHLDIPRLTHTFDTIKLDISRGNLLPALMELEALSVSEDPVVCDLMVRAGLVSDLTPLLNHLDNPQIPHHCTNILCDIFSSTPSETSIPDCNDLIPTVFSLLTTRPDLVGTLILIISNIVSDSRCEIEPNRLSLWTDLTADCLKRGESKDTVSNVLWCLGSLLRTEEVPERQVDRIVEVFRRYCELPYEPIWAPALVRGLKACPDGCLLIPEILTFLLKSVMYFPGNESIYFLLKTAYSSDPSCDIQRLFKVLDPVLTHAKASTRKHGFEMLYVSLDFYPTVRKDIVSSPLWKTAVRGLTDSDGYVQTITANFYLSFDSDYASNFGEIIPEMMDALRGLDHTLDLEAQLVSSTQNLLELIKHLMEVCRDIPQDDLVSQLESAGVMDAVDRLVESTNSHISDAAFEVMCYQSEREFTQADCVHPASGFVFS